MPLPVINANIASHVPLMAALQPHRAAVIFPQARDAQGRVAYTHLTFTQLERETRILAAGMERLGLKRGERVVLMVKPSLDFFSLTFALFQLGAVPVFIDPGMGIRHLGTCLAEAEPDAFIGIPKAQLARLVLRWPKGRLAIWVGKRPPLAGPSLDNVRTLGLAHADSWQPPATESEQTAAILFTSGSTGVPKGVIYSHGIFSAQVEQLRNCFGIQPGEIDLCTFPLFALFAPALGMTAVIPEMDFTRPARVNPERIREAIENFGCSNLFGSPALLDRVSRIGSERGYRFPSLRRVISAGAPVSPAILGRFKQMLPPGVEIFTPYGATESLPVCNMGSDAILGETAEATANGKGVCVGFPVPRMRVEILAISDEPIGSWPETQLGPGQIGEICVQGPVVTRAYFHREQSTLLAKIPDPSGGFWHRMGDLGYRDAEGRIWFCGRKSHRVETAAGTLFTIPVEGVFNAHPAVYRTALVGIGAGPHKKPVVCVELEKGIDTPKQTQIFAELAQLGARHAHTKALNTFLLHPGFPVDIRHNAKIFREKLALWAGRSLS